MTDGPTLRPLAEPLHIAALELADLARMGDQLQQIVARLACGPGPLEAGMIVEAQLADVLSQRLTGMAAFLRALADAAPRDVTADVQAAVIGLTLAEQARRLAGPAPGLSPACTCAAEDQGELQLFGD